MKLLYFFIFLVFSFVNLFPEAQVFIQYPVNQNMDLFNWQAFTKKETIQSRIDFRNESFNLFGADTLRLNSDKIDLSRIEQELFLYEQGFKEGLSDEEIERVREAISLHRENISNIENSILDELLGAGLEIDSNQVLEKQPAIDIVKELYKGDYEIVFNLVEKKDENLYSYFNNDEDYARLILPQVEQYTSQMGKIAQSYYDSFLSPSSENTLFDRNKFINLTDMHSDSFLIYKCFLKNFENPEGENQKKLKQTIESWYEQQSELSATALIEAFREKEESNPFFIVSRLNRFNKEITSSELKKMIAQFYKNDIINNPVFIDTNESREIGARVDALVGLKYLGVLEEEEYKAERELFERAVNAEIIKPVGENYYSTYSRPIP